MYVVPDYNTTYSVVTFVAHLIYKICESLRGSGKTHRKKRRIRPRMQYVYVDSGADRLQEKYEELRNLLTDNRRSVTRRRRYDDELAKQARDAILQHEVNYNCTCWPTL